MGDMKREPIKMSVDDFMDMREGEARTHKYYASLGSLVMYCLDNDISLDFNRSINSDEYVRVTCQKGPKVMNFVLHRSLLMAGEICIKLYDILAELEDD